MKILLLIVTIFISLPVLASDECQINGVFISDVSKTLTDYSIENTISSSEQNDALIRLFGGVKHEWRCDEFRAGLNGYPSMDWTRITMSRIGPNTQLVSFPDTKDPDLYLAFEGPCYKIRVTNQNYFEYFCPLDTQ